VRCLPEENAVHDVKSIGDCRSGAHAFTTGSKHLAFMPPPLLLLLLLLAPAINARENQQLNR